MRNTLFNPISATEKLLSPSFGQARINQKSEKARVQGTQN